MEKQVQRGSVKKMDPNFVSNQKWEIQYVSNKFRVKPEKVREAKKKVGTSRRKIYNYLRLH